MRQNDKAKKAMQTMTEQMINRIEAMRANGTDTFALPWFEIKGRNFCPQNVSGWLKGLREEPQYLLEIVTEVQKATSMIFSHLGISNWEE